MSISTRRALCTGMVIAWIIWIALGLSGNTVLIIESAEPSNENNAYPVTINAFGVCISLLAGYALYVLVKTRNENDTNGGSDDYDYDDDDYGGDDKPNDTGFSAKRPLPMSAYGA